MTMGRYWLIELSSQQVDGQASQVEHQGGHQEVDHHGDNPTHEGHAGGLGQILIITPVACKAMVLEQAWLRTQGRV